MPTYRGSCHCGNVRFSVGWTLTSVMECNCSHCFRKGFMLWFVPRATLELIPPATPLTSYRFNKHVIEHEFCPVCGVQCFAYGKDPSTGAETAAINVRCLEDADLSDIERVPVDGKSF